MTDLSVKATDVFGRTDADTIKLSGTYGEELNVQLPEQKKMPGPGDDDEDLLGWINDRGFQDPRIRMLIRFARASDLAGLDLTTVLDKEVVAQILEAPFIEG